MAQKISRRRTIVLGTLRLGHRLADVLPDFVDGACIIQSGI